MRQRPLYARFRDWPTTSAAWAALALIRRQRGGTAAQSCIQDYLWRHQAGFLPGGDDLWMT
ncbi:hypothetical protein BOS5A_211365 [Bosea sp. EC-HK365B]|nr:hypothetical protein BOSE21B_50325 [Bosea sp. 21B]CAD5301292.1 hypothetical protein BOSE7B_90364 [Bosea sp. 7B]VVT60574.1 hypothetical protein BOS5A_211365 [Bosea sp. EC-HK365B]VXB66940.1 hypothetical protein BOSE127_140305 [Bosea sp. 127]